MRKHRQYIKMVNVDVVFVHAAINILATVIKVIIGVFVQQLVNLESLISAAREIANWSLMSDYTLVIQGIEEGHIVIGHASIFKVLDENGNVYWAQRHSELNDMEVYGMVTSYADDIAKDLLSMKRPG